MPMVPPTEGTPNRGGSKPGRKPSLVGKKRQRRPKKKTQAAPSSTKHVKNRQANVLQLPSVKVTVRNIGNTEKHGSCSKVISMLRSLVDHYNNAEVSTKSNNDVPIVLEEDSTQRFLQIEELKRAKSLESEEGQFANTKEDFVNSAKANISPEEKKDPLHTSLGETNNDGKNSITARILYIVPPRKSRRRGEIAGRAYIILQPPSKLLCSTSERDCKISAVHSILPSADRSRVIAQSRLLLEQAVKRLSDCKPSFGGILVEQSVSQKTWKESEFLPSTGQYKKYPKYDSSIEKTDDFKAFLEKSKREEDERLARPKPTPGGGVESVTSGAGPATFHADALKNTDGRMSPSSSAMSAQQVVERGHPVAALVLHLREKRQKENLQKQLNMSAASTSRMAAKPTKKTSASGSSRAKTGVVDKKEPGAGSRPRSSSSSRNGVKNTSGTREKASNGKGPSSSRARSSNNTAAGVGGENGNSLSRREGEEKSRRGRASNGSSSRRTRTKPPLAEKKIAPPKILTKGG